MQKWSEVAAGGGGINDEAVRGAELPVAASGLYKTHTQCSNTLDGGGATHGQAQLPADEQQATTGPPRAAVRVLLVRTWGPLLRHVHWLSLRRPCHPRLLCHSGSRGTSSKVVDDVPRTWFLRLICIQTLHRRLCHVFSPKNRVYSPKGHRWV
jgi:hypothetical protein